MKKINNNESMKITESAFYDMVNYIGYRPSESGGAGFGYESDNVIRDFVPDSNAKTTRSSYTMDTPFLNKEIKKRWDNNRKSLLMIAHAHPHGNSKLSGPDKQYFQELLKNMHREKFYTPILFTIPDGGLKVFPYVYEKGSDTPKHVRLEIVPDDYNEQKEAAAPKKEKKKIKKNEEKVERTIVVFAGSQKKKSFLTENISSFLSIILCVAIAYGIVFTTSFYAVKLLTELILKFI